MKRRIKRGIPWPEGAGTRIVGPYPPWEVFRDTTLKKYFPNSHSPFEPEDEGLFKTFYVIRRLTQLDDPNADAERARWEQDIEEKIGVDFFERYRKVIDAIVKETTTSSGRGKERR